MGFSIKDAKIAYYAAKYHTADLVNKILSTYHDNSIDDKKKKYKIGRYCAAVAIRNIKKSSPKAIISATKYRTYEVVEKIEKLQSDFSVDPTEKRKKINRYCLAVALRRGAIAFKEDNSI